MAKVADVKAPEDKLLMRSKWEVITQRSAEKGQKAREEAAREYEERTAKRDLLKQARMRNSEPTTKPVPPKQGLPDCRPVKLDSPSKPGYHSNHSERTVLVVPKRCSWGSFISGNPEIEQIG